MNHQSPTILAIDTCFGTFSITLSVGEKEITHFESQEHIKQAELLIPKIEEILSAEKLQYKDLDYIAVNVGPGSFTGLRIGLAAVKGIILAMPKITAIAVTSLEAASLAKGGGEIFLSAGRDQAFTQKFDEKNIEITSPQLVEHTGNFDPNPNSRLISAICLQKINHSQIDSRHNKIIPVYIRKPDAKLPTKNSRNVERSN